MKPGAADIRNIHYKCIYNSQQYTMFFDTGILYSIFYKNSSFL